jgi:hypothetical protein
MGVRKFLSRCREGGEVGLCSFGFEVLVKPLVWGASGWGVCEAEEDTRPAYHPHHHYKKRDIQDKRMVPYLYP